MVTKTQLLEAKNDARRRLLHYGIDDDFTLKFHAGNYLAQYRSHSQFRSTPIFWVNPKHRPGAELVRTLLHEYAHVIYEMARLHSSGSAEMAALFDYINTVFMDDEEEFAESFAISAFMLRSHPWIDDVTRMYANYMESGG